MKKIDIYLLIKKIIQNEDKILYKILVFFILFISIFLIMTLQPASRYFKPKIGNIVPRDIIAHKDFKYVDEELTRKNLKNIKNTTPPVYLIDDLVSESNYKKLEKTFRSIIEFQDYQSFFEKTKNLEIHLNLKDFMFLKELFTKNEASFDRILFIYSKIMNDGIIELSKDKINSLETSGLIIAKIKNAKVSETLFLVDELIDLRKAKSKLKDLIDNEFIFYNEYQKKQVFDLISNYLIVNIHFNKEITENKMTEKIRNDSKIIKKIKKNQVIARNGDVITEENISQINAINMNSEKNIDSRFLLGSFLFLLVIFIFSYFFIILCDKTFFDDFKNIIFISSSLLVFVIYISIPIYFGIDKSNGYYGILVPISTFSLTFVFLYSQRISCFLTIIYSLVFFAVSGFNFSSFLFVFFSGTFSVFTISTVKKRIDLFLTGFLIAGLNVVISLSIYFIIKMDVLFTNFMIISICNGFFSAILALGFISIGENALNSPTIFRLQELSDASSPLLKELFDNAVGTYNHSILVANLAEAAANEIGANGLLARVGGYFHDIGKIESPEYFIENQGKFNIHSTLKPSISAAIIKSHVRKGVERAIKEKLPKKVIDIIAQHHGNTLIRFFYEQAKRSNIENKEEIQEDLYRYKEDIPQFPEAAIVLISDQVEATARVIKKATMSSVEKLVENVVDAKFQEGIIDDSGLTLKDITKIKKVFVKHILGMYHSRIEYPESAKDSNNHKNVKRYSDKRKYF